MKYVVTHTIRDPLRPSFPHRSVSVYDTLTAAKVAMLRRMQDYLLAEQGFTYIPGTVAVIQTSGRREVTLLTQGD